LLFLFVAALALFSGAETALFSLSSVQVKTFKNDPDKRKRLIAELLAQPRELLVTLIILIILMSILVQNTISTIVGEKGGWFDSVVIPLMVNLVLGEVIPKSLALPNNTKVALKTSQLIFSLQRIFYPLRRVLAMITNFVVKVFFFFLHKEEEISTDELQHALATSKEHGVLQSEEAELIRGYLKLEESSVKELMRPREEILYFDLEESLTKLIHLFVDQECSRILICRQGLDSLEGIMSSRSFFLHKQRIHKTEDLLPFLDKPFFVPEVMTAEMLLKNMYERQQSLAVVVDEYSSISGLIAFEDLVEVVIGEISDRRDAKVLYTRSKGDVIIASGKLELDELEELFDEKLYSPNQMVTVGGWLTEQLGDIPKTGTKYVTDSFLFHVLAADPTRVRRIYIRHLHPKKKTSGENS
jgi:putative hemolysin